MMKAGTEELLRQNVFSSIHMSTEVKSGQASICYPICSFCGGMATGSKKTERKVATFQLSLYTNSSESFVVWSKKPEEPKGMLWLRSCCIRRGSDTEGMPIELISKGCRGRCSYTLRFTRRPVAEEWYRCLRQESRKSSPEESDDPFSSDSGEESNPLDSILSETHLDLVSEEPRIQTRKISTPDTRQKSNSPDGISSKKKTKKSKNKFQIPFSSSIMDRKVSLPVSTSYTHTTVDSPASPETEALGRWSWPVKVSN